MFADGLGLPIGVAEASETGALGAAIGAGIAAGFFADYEAGIRAMTRPKAAFTPDRQSKGHYDRRYRLYRDLSENLRGFWSALQDRGSGGA